jgi:CelD/BcsL family acetyltransferase involved in cellulose biosynthesis
MMTWELYKLSGDLDRHQQAWDRLNSELCARNPYFASSFIEPLLKHFGKGNERLCVLRHEDEVSAMLIVEPAGKGKWVTFLPPQGQISPVMIREPVALRSLIPRLSFSAMALDCLSQDPLITRLDSRNRPLPVVRKRHALTISISLTTTFDEYWDRRPKKLRQNVSRRIRRALEDIGNLKYACVTDPELIGAAVKRYGDLETRGWKGQEGTAIGANNVQGLFYTDVMKRFAEQGKALAYELYFDDRLVASRLAVASDKMLVMLKTTYDEAESKLAPGRLLLYLVLEAEFKAQRYRTIEFYTDANKDLVEWSTGQRWIEHYLLLRSFPLQRLHRVVYKKR